MTQLAKQQQSACNGNEDDEDDDYYSCVEEIKDDSEADNDDEDDQEDAPFQIVLVDMKKAAMMEGIHCVKRSLDTDEDLKFVAISYRWADLNEAVTVTPDYMAHIRSFRMTDFSVLCKMMLQEPDLKHMEYVWVDSISIDQLNEARRKETVYRMTDIYMRANYIIACPDLHWTYLARTHKHLDWIYFAQKHQLYIYHLIRGNIDELIAMDEAWMDSIGIPKRNDSGDDGDDGSDIRKKLPKNTNHMVDDLMYVNVKDVDKQLLFECLERAFHNSQRSQIRGDTGVSPLVAPCVFSLSVENETHCQPAKWDIHDLKQQLTERKGSYFQNIVNSNCDDNGNDYKHYLFHLLTEVQHDEWKRLIAQRFKELSDAMTFLQSLVEDWANRVWVIQEISIAKEKSETIKYWFISLNCSNLYGQPFLESDFVWHNYKKGTGYQWYQRLQQQKYQRCMQNEKSDLEQLVHYPMTERALTLGAKFNNVMRYWLTGRDFLVTMLGSKATRNEDRFHAILPSSYYRQEIIDKNTISTWHITDGISVRLKLLEICYTFDQLNLLYNCSRSTLIPVLPTFVSHHRPNFQVLIKFHEHVCNFVMRDRRSVLLMPRALSRKKHQLSSRLHILRLQPIIYYISLNVTAIELDERRKRHLHLWRKLRLEDDPLVLISIPLFVLPFMLDKGEVVLFEELNVSNENSNEDTRGDNANKNIAKQSNSGKQQTKKIRDIQLVGNLERNIWVVQRYSDDVLKHHYPVDEWSKHHDYNNGIGFYVY